MTIIEALLASPAGSEIRAILRLQSEAVFTEVLHVRLRRVIEQESSCEIRVCIAKIEDSVLAQDAVEVVFRCLGVSCLDWHSSFYEQKDIPQLNPASSEIEIDTEDSFRVLCQSFDVLSVRVEKLRDTLDDKNA